MQTDIKSIQFKLWRIPCLVKRLMSLSLITGIFLLPQVYAQSTHFISPRLQLGLHTESSLKSPIIKLISSGTAVEVLKTKKEFTQIKTEKGAQGWIKSKFLTQEEPAELKVTALEQSLAEVKEQLLAAQNKKNNAQESNNNASKQRVSEDNNAQTKMAAYEETIAELKAEIKAWEQLDSQDKQAQKEKANQINQHLKERLVKIAALATGQETNISGLNLSAISPSSQSDIGAERPFLEIIKKDYLFHLMIGGICFVLGLFLMDMFNRRRHGGYRI